MPPESSPPPAAPVPSNAALVRRLFGLAWRYRGHCLLVLGLQLVLLTLGIAGLSFTGVGIDYIRHRAGEAPAATAAGPFHLVLPENWEPLSVLGLLAGLILLLALCRALLNYA